MEAINIMPHPALRPYVLCYYVVKQGNGVPFSTRLLPTGYTKWMFHRKCPFVSDKSSGSVPLASVCGPYQKSMTILSAASFEMITVIFHFHCSSIMTGVPPGLLADRIVDFDDMEDAGLRDLKGRVLDAVDTSEAINFIEQYLLRRVLNSGGSKYERQLASAVQLLGKDPDSSVVSLSESACMSERQFRRLFTEQIGLSPKQFVRLRRFLALSNFLSEGHNSISEGIWRFGYTDHSHLDKDFRYYASMSASEYLEYLRTVPTKQTSEALRDYYSGK